jgi:chromosome partitioning protein
MKTISICSTKCGTGKSTLCVTLATYLHAQGESVCLIDLDTSQGSTSAWHRVRGKTPGPELIHSRGLRADLRRLAARGTAYVFIDSPPTLDDGGIVETAVDAADYILSPCRPSILDIGAAETIANLAITKALGFVLMDCTPEWKSTTTKAAKALADVGHVFKAQLTHRHSYLANMAAGRTGPETDKEAAGEVEALWREVSKWMK